MFIVNDKGTSWAYATPGFNNSLNPEVMKQLRTLAEVPESAKIFTEVSVRAQQRHTYMYASPLVNK
jgi:hypothetical protein